MTYYRLTADVVSDNFEFTAGCDTVDLPAMTLMQVIEIHEAGPRATPDYDVVVVETDDERTLDATRRTVEDLLVAGYMVEIDLG